MEEEKEFKSHFHPPNNLWASLVSISPTHLGAVYLHSRSLRIFMGTRPVQKLDRGSCSLTVIAFNTYKPRSPEGGPSPQQLRKKESGALHPALYVLLLAAGDFFCDPAQPRRADGRPYNVSAFRPPPHPADKRGRGGGVFRTGLKVPVQLHRTSFPELGVSRSATR